MYRFFFFLSLIAITTVTGNVTPKYWSQKRVLSYRPLTNLSIHFSKQKYVTFNPDGAGWNNIRMGVEIVVAIAHLTGRTLVIPEPQRWDGFDKFEELIDLVALGDEVPWVFAKSVDLSTKSKHNVQFTALSQYLVVGNKDSPNVKKHVGEYFRSWNPVTWDIIKLDTIDVLHFEGRDPNRLLGLFYMLIVFEDVSLEKFYHRLIRDHVRYHPTIFNAAQSIIEQLPTDFPAVHVRHNDFVVTTQVTKEQMEDTIKNHIGLWKPGLVYVATDEMKRNFFFGLPYQLVFLRDFPESTARLSNAAKALVEQLVCSRAKVFIGSKYSTYSAYIYRLRIYNGLKEYSYLFNDDVHLMKHETWHTSYYPSWGREYVIANQT